MNQFKWTLFYHKYALCLDHDANFMKKFQLFFTDFNYLMQSTRTYRVTMFARICCPYVYAYLCTKQECSISSHTTNQGSKLGRIYFGDICLQCGHENCDVLSGKLVKLFRSTFSAGHEPFDEAFPYFWGNRKTFLFVSILYVFYFYFNICYIHAYR